MLHLREELNRTDPKENSAPEVDVGTEIDGVNLRYKLATALADLGQGEGRWQQVKRYFILLLVFGCGQLPFNHVLMLERIPRGLFKNILGALILFFGILKIFFLFCTTSFF